MRPALCNLNKDSGPCKAAVDMYFFNNQTESCEKFMYGGCKGNENKFEKMEDCKNTCKGMRTINLKTFIKFTSKLYSIQLYSLARNKYHYIYFRIRCDTTT